MVTTQRNKNTAQHPGPLHGSHTGSALKCLCWRSNSYCRKHGHKSILIAGVCQLCPAPNAISGGHSCRNLCTHGVCMCVSKAGNDRYYRARASCLYCGFQAGVSSKGDMRKVSELCAEDDDDELLDYELDVLAGHGVDLAPGSTSADLARLTKDVRPASDVAFRAAPLTARFEFGRATYALSMNRAAIRALRNDSKMAGIRAISLAYYLIFGTHGQYGTLVTGRGLRPTRGVVNGLAPVDDLAHVLCYRVETEYAAEARAAVAASILQAAAKSCEYSFDCTKASFENPKSSLIQKFENDKIQKQNEILTTPAPIPASRKRARAPVLEFCDCGCLVHDGPCDDFYTEIGRRLRASKPRFGGIVELVEPRTRQTGQPFDSGHRARFTRPAESNVALYRGPSYSIKRFRTAVRRQYDRLAPEYATPNEIEAAQLEHIAAHEDAHASLESHWIAEMRRRNRARRRSQSKILRHRSGYRSPASLRYHLRRSIARCRITADSVHVGGTGPCWLQLRHAFCEMDDDEECEPRVANRACDCQPPLEEMTCPSCEGRDEDCFRCGCEEGDDPDERTIYGPKTDSKSMAELRELCEAEWTPEQMNSVWVLSWWTGPNELHLWYVSREEQDSPGWMPLQAWLRTGPHRYYNSRRPDCFVEGVIDSEECSVQKQFIYSVGKIVDVKVAAVVGHTHHVTPVDEVCLRKSLIDRAALNGDYRRMFAIDRMSCHDLGCSLDAPCADGRLSEFAKVLCGVAPTYASWRDPAATRSALESYAARMEGVDRNAFQAVNDAIDRGAFASASRMRSNVRETFMNGGRRKHTSVHAAQPLEFSPGRWVPPARRETSLNAASAAASAKILLGPEALQGETHRENLDIAREAFGTKNVRTSIPPADKSYRRLVKALQLPLRYVPGIEAHPEAATCRRAHMNAMYEATRCGTIGMVAPSYAEWHMNPAAFGWYNNVDPLDAARFNRPCTKCKDDHCHILANARKHGRVVDGDLSSAIAHFRFARVDYLWMVNIEPNISSHDVLRLMADAGIRNGFSAFTQDPRILATPNTVDVVTKQRATRRLDKVVTSFDNGASYTAPYANVRDLFGVTSSRHGSLRRTVMNASGAAILCEIQYSPGQSTSAMNPLYNEHYLIPVPHPTSVIAYVFVEREGFDRLLQLFRTTTDRTVEAARIQLRQSNVTYSVSGSQLTPRLAVSATDSELLSVWMVGYSELCDIISKQSLATMASDTKQNVSTSVTNALFQRITATACGNSPLTSSASALRAWIQALQVDGKYQTLDAISDHAYEEVFGKPIDVDDTIASLRNLFPSVPTMSALLARLDTFTRANWRRAFNVAAVLTEVLILSREFAIQSFAIVLECTRSLCRLLGIETDVPRRLQHWLDTCHRPGATILHDMITAQGMPFQAACIYIVESFTNNWYVDPEVEAQVAREAHRFFDQAPEPPYTRFVLEIKAVLRAFNSRTSAFSRAHQLMTHIRERLVYCRPEDKAALLQLQIDVQKEVDTIAAEPEPARISTTSVFALDGGRPQPVPAPMHMVEVFDEHNARALMTIEQAFHNRATIIVDSRVPETGPGRFPYDVDMAPRTIERLPMDGDRASFAPIHEQMRQGVLAEFLEDRPIQAFAEPAPGMHIYSPDELGAKMLRNACLASALDQTATPNFVNRDDVIAWRDDQLANPMLLPAVRRALSRIDDDRLDLRPLPHIAHIQGLAMGGKSAGVRNWITNEDAIVVPTAKLKTEWEEALGLLDPVHRASVYTQHNALSLECKRFVIVDEAYTFTGAHLQAIRHRRTGLGFITIGDEMQIGSVLDPNQPQWYNHDRPARLTFISPVSFVPYDAFYVYLRNSRPVSRHLRYYAGSNVVRGLLYQISDDVVIPGLSDIAINGLQASKANMRNLGIERAITAHESQGSRSEYTFIHSQLDIGVCPDFTFLNNSPAHLVVSITRARRGTVFIVNRRSTLQALNIFDNGQINGNTGVVYSIGGGTVFDLVDPTSHYDATVDHCLDPVRIPSDTPMASYDAQISVGAVIDPERQEAVAVEEIMPTIDVTRMARVVMLEQPRAGTTKESFIPTGSDIPGNGPIQAMQRFTPPTRITSVDRAAARILVNRIFLRCIDKNRFFSMLSLRRPILGRLPRNKLLAMANAEFTRPALAGRAFPKNEIAKKTSTIGIGNTFKTLSVTSQSAGQIAMFMETCDSLTHAWARSGRDGFISPVGLTRTEINGFLSGDAWSWELDISAQDSSHTATHVAVFTEFLGMAADKLGMDTLASDIRLCRSVSDHISSFSFEMGSGLGSGDAWTLIANCIMATTTLVGRFYVPPVYRMLQVGDDCTLDRRFRKRDKPDHGTQYVRFTDNHVPGHPSFTSFRQAMPDVVLPTRIRFLVKMAFKQRTSLEHGDYRIEMRQFRAHIAKTGLSAYCEHVAHGAGTDSMAVEQIVQAALRVSTLEYDQLPAALRTENGNVTIEVISRRTGCFGWALAHAVEAPDIAISVVNAYNYGPSLSECVNACVKYKVRYHIAHRKWSNTGKRYASDVFQHGDTSSPLVILFSDHAVCARRRTYASYMMTEFTRFLDTEDYIDDF